MIKKTNVIEKEAILPRISGIQKNLAKLAKLSEVPLSDFVDSDEYDLAQHHLRLALEGVFHISTHILSRIPGARAVEYKEIARRMGEVKIVPKKFAESKLVPMAGLRNILVHAYSEIDATKFHEIISEHRPDIEEFLGYIKKVLNSPEKWDLQIN
ncbi:MAG: DUF86 domain-containing protein [Deltaproteobacteria bacterium]|nr:DUF86 domain-containing protein [Deltaproteobacteria bacterium]